MSGTREESLGLLSLEERGRLLGAFPLAIGFIAQADGRVSFFEKFAAYRILVDLPRALGTDAGVLAGAMDPHATQKRLMAKMRRAVEEELEEAAALMEKLPEGTRARVHGFFLDACMKVASASGGITDEEKQALRMVLNAFRVPIPPEVMEKLVIRE